MMSRPSEEEQLAMVVKNLLPYILNIYLHGISSILKL